MAENKRRGDDDPAAEGAGGGDADLEAMLEETDEEPEQAEKAERKSAVEPFESRKVKPGEKGPGLFGRFTRFVREVVAELRKVIWPTRKELLTYTSVVIVFVVIMLSIVGLLDLGFAKVLLLIFGA